MRSLRPAARTPPAVITPDEQAPVSPRRVNETVLVGLSSLRHELAIPASRKRYWFVLLRFKGLLEAIRVS